MTFAPVHLAPQATISPCSDTPAPAPRWPALTLARTLGTAELDGPDIAALDLHERHELAHLSIEIAETQGRRATQEDAFFLSSTRFARHADTAQFLNAAFRATHERTQYNECGTTCTVAVIAPDDTLTFAHLGDSPAMLFVFNEITGEVHFKNLLREHHAQDPDEAKRIADAYAERYPDPMPDFDGILPGTKRIITQAPSLSTALAVSRAFGDRQFTWALGREPEITHVDLAALIPDRTPADRVFLCVACDGLTEAAPHRGDDVFESLADCLRTTVREEGTQHLAAALVHHAARRGRDNITAMVTELPAGGAPHNRNVVLGICDGHAGGATARFVAEHLKHIFDTADGASAAHPGEITNRAVRELITRITAGAVPESIGPRTIYAAAQSGNLEALHDLIRAGVNIDHPGANGFNALHRAVWWGSTLALTTLIEAGADVNAPGARGFTALHIAARNGARDLAEILLQHGAKRDALSEFPAPGLIPRDVADLFGNHESRWLLFEPKLSLRTPPGPLSLQMNRLRIRDFIDEASGQRTA